MHFYKLRLGKAGTVVWGFFFLTHPESAGQQEPPPQAILDAAFLVIFTIGTQVWDLKARAHLVSFTILPEETDMEAVEYRA